MLKRNRKIAKDGNMSLNKTDYKDMQRENMEYLQSNTILSNKLYPKETKLISIRNELSECKILLSKLNGDYKQIENKLLICSDKQLTSSQRKKKQELEDKLSLNIIETNKIKKRIRELNKNLD